MLPESAETQIAIFCERELMSKLLNRRTLLKYGTTAAASAALGNLVMGQNKAGSPQRVVVIMFDGFDPRYLAESR
jgi:hypothetical protein